MPRYVEIDDVEVSDYVTVWDCNCSEFGKQTVMAVDDLQYLPTADVVPKSEVFLASSDAMKMLIECHGYALTHDADIKKEVAREIFEEIEERLASLEYHIQSPRKTVKIEELKAQVDWILHEVVPKTLAELKKKYIGESDVKRDTV